VCEIFGFVFTATTPVTFEDIVEGLGVSNGSASHGLRYLRRIGALSVTYLARDRRDYYVAEISLGRLASGYVLENITHHLADNRERISAMRSALASEEEGSSHLSSRVDVLLDWNRQVSAAIALATATIVPRATDES
jgi:DNA-binding transcriptional regulator GbsR (MarR family)